MYLYVYVYTCASMRWCIKGIHLNCSLITVIMGGYTWNLIQSCERHFRRHVPRTAEAFQFRIEHRLVLIITQA